MKLDYILASLVIASITEAAPIKRGLFEDLFGTSSSNTAPAPAPAAAPAPAPAPAAAAQQAVNVNTPPAAAPAAAPATTTAASSSKGFWAGLFGGDSTNTASTAAAAAAPAPASASVASAPAAVAPVAAPAASTPQSTSSSSSFGGFFSNLYNDFFGSSSANANPQPQAPAQAQAPVQATKPTSAAPVVVTSAQIYTSVVTSAAPAAAAASPVAANGNSGSDDYSAEGLFAFLFGGGKASATASSASASSNPIYGSGSDSGSGSGSGNSAGNTGSSSGTTLGVGYQGGSPGKNTASINTATATAINGGSAAGATAAAGSLGITYSPYTKSDGCKSASQIAQDIAKLSNYEVIRLYSTDCSGIENVLSAMGSNQKLFLGVWNIDSPQGELQDIVNAVKQSSSGWNVVHTIAIGNERVNAGAASVAQVQQAVDLSKKYLKSQGYNGPIVTVDTLVAYVGNPQLCEMSDYLAVNSHPYWDGGVQPENSGQWLLQQIAHLQSVCGSSKDVLITETGWPTQGDAYGQCVPSVQNQVAAVKSIVKSLSDKVIMFTMFNDYWKDPGAYNVEQHWGLYGDPSS
ncbi:SCW/CMP-family cell wall glucosidase precursor, putative [Candida dubliniensis CD36]|uniref:SCW/CMP-family cell wall glucosidase, putative n=1 Tax=Candida dubliniensis (strain CD36 / ATCC MYA-646 / CBS 7987 / NCPF 3949 / NRRL Y-17841) TaxID=573826 RepID=B9W739_CANDC|nr:SCW/CMP-family cell wall glucosidase precursor, putative [Candida dubliniensis CD36]CAX44497.1 SCW/CMP-family cell wall glucosidase precursor, putative [Candida dubliniensis CD36]